MSTRYTHRSHDQCAKNYGLPVVSLVTVVVQIVLRCLNQLENW